MNTDEGLKREVGLWGLTLNIINVVIGSGIFVLPAFVAGGLGTAGIFAYLFCGLLISLVMLCFAELGSKITVTGGAYTYVEVAFGRYAGFLATNAFIFGAQLLSDAAVANALMGSLAAAFPVLGTPWIRASLLIALFGGLAVINVIGVKQGITLVKLVTTIKLIPLFVLVIVGIHAVVPGNLSIVHIPPLSTFGKISIVLFFAFQGAEGSLSMGGEVKNPQKTFPRAIFTAFSIILVLYMSVQIVAQGILGDEFSKFGVTPLTEVGSRTMGVFGIALMTVGAAISMFGYVSSDVMNVPRIIFRSAFDRVLPIPPLARVSKRFSTPYIAIIGYTVICCFLAITGEFEQLVVLSSSSVLLIYIAVSLATIKLRKKKLEGEGAHFVIPGGYIVPALASIASAWLLFNLTTPEQAGIGIMLVVLSVIYYALRLIRNRKEQAAKP